MQNLEWEKYELLFRMRDIKACIIQQDENQEN